MRHNYENKREAYNRVVEGPLDTSGVEDSILKSSVGPMMNINQTQISQSNLLASAATNDYTGGRFLGQMNSNYLPPTNLPNRSRSGTGNMRLNESSEVAS